MHRHRASRRRSTASGAGSRELERAARGGHRAMPEAVFEWAARRVNAPPPAWPAPGKADRAGAQVAVDDVIEDADIAGRVARSACPRCTSRIASAVPASRGSRWVPPAPGMMPSKSSG